MGTVVGMVSRVSAALEKRYSSKGLVVAGLDEVGRGAWAGPVSVGAVVYDPGAVVDRLDDSKRLNPSLRERVYDAILSSGMLWSVGSATSREVDSHGLTAALHLASRRALKALGVSCDVVLLDGNYDYVNRGVPAREVLKVVTCVKGDERHFSVAAASVVAKVSRDRYMSSRRQSAAYNWAANKGYATLEHAARVDEMGLSSLHRRSFSAPASSNGYGVQ